MDNKILIVVTDRTTQLLYGWSGDRWVEGRGFRYKTKAVAKAALKRILANGKYDENKYCDIRICTIEDLFISSLERSIMNNAVARVNL